MIDTRRAELLLSADGIHKTFGKTPAIPGLDLALRPGEVMAVTGESGSGKSTLLLCLAGILAVDLGVVRFGAVDLASLSDADRTALRRREFGFVFQMGFLVPDLSAIDNVALPLMLDGTVRGDAREQARDWLARFGVEDMADRKPGEMSGGQSQRVAVARALIASPRVVFADEPTGSLDSKNAELVLQLLVDGARRRDAALLLVTHSDPVARAADRRLVMRDGMLDGAVS